VNKELLGNAQSYGENNQAAEMADINIITTICVSHHNETVRTCANKKIEV